MSELHHNEGGHSALCIEVADRLRGRMAEKRIRQSEVMLATGWSKTTAWRKLNGHYPIDVDEFNALWEAFGISPVYLITGDRDNLPHPGGGQARAPIPFEPPVGIEPTSFAYLVSGQPAQTEQTDERAALHLVVNR